MGLFSLGEWPQSMAVASRPFIEKMNAALGFRANGRNIICAHAAFELLQVLTPDGKADKQDSLYSPQKKEMNDG